MARKVFMRVLLPLLIVGLGVGATWLVFFMAPTVAQGEVSETAPVVEVAAVERGPATAEVDATGTVIPAVEATITPEVNGRVVARNPSLVPGGRLTKGELLIRIDPRDYRLALDQEEARVASSVLEVETEQGRGTVAEREWALMGNDRPDESPPLALRVPNIKAAKANLRAARSSLERAKLNLSRTTLRAPWNALVVDAQAQIGQVVSAATKVATLVGTDRVWVKVGVPLDRLPELDMPGSDGEGGSKARVVHVLGRGREVVREGRIVRLESELDAQTRSAQLLVEVRDPFDRPAGAVPLLPGSYVRVELMGKTVDGVFAVPRQAVFDGNTVWRVDGHQRLERRSLEIGWGTEDTLYATAGLEPGDRVVLTKLGTPIAGMAVRPRDQSTAAPEAPAPSER